VSILGSEALLTRVQWLGSNVLVGLLVAFRYIHCLGEMAILSILGDELLINRLELQLAMTNDIDATYASRSGQVRAG